MKYIIMCGGTYAAWSTPRQMIQICGEPIVARTIRLLRRCGVNDIYISTNDERFERFGVPILRHANNFQGYARAGCGSWAEAFYPTKEPACYLMGDVVFSPDAIRRIVETHTHDIEFFASAPPFDVSYIKPYAEPFAFKVVDQEHFRNAVETTIANETSGLFYRRPIAWELWQIIKETPVNQIRENYTIINDYTCDVDAEKDAYLIEAVMKGD